MTLNNQWLCVHVQSPVLQVYTYSYLHDDFDPLSCDSCTCVLFFYVII